MINFTDLTGLASSAIALTAMVVLLPGVARFPKPYYLLLVSAIALVVVIPCTGLPLAAYVRGWLGDLSITSLLLLLLTILRPLGEWLPCGCFKQQSSAEALFPLLIIVLAALSLYPMALGIGLFDPYRLGYGNPWFLGGLLLLTLIASFSKLSLLALAIALAVLAWGIGWYESMNLWDYLLDPLLVIYAISELLRRGAKALSAHLRIIRQRL